MYLKSLELHGFKSFADRTKFVFGRGLTGIVGPNGCGKSNVVDAIRWVLGETSAKALRGGEMADVIFNGAETRKPLSMAEVTLTLADCEAVLGVDYNEVSVTRRVFRDGKSEYRLNGTLCRLRDVHDLFMDTGIGRTSYSIMEQGKIDMLLSSKPEDRRQVFEEAAGITKFKKDKKEALRKLEYTEANLLRVSDVLEEQQKRMSSLQRQVAKARKYQTLADDIQVLDTHLNHQKYSRLKADKERRAQGLQQLKRNTRLLEAELADKEREITKARQEFESLEQPLIDLRKELSEKGNLISSSSSRILFNTERESELRARISQARQEIAEAKAKQARGEEEKKTLSAVLEGYETKVAALTQKAEVQSKALDQSRDKRRKIESEQSAVSSEYQRLQAKRAAAQARIESAQSQFDRDRGRYDQCCQEYEHLHKEMRLVEEAEKDLLIGFEAKQAAYQALQKKLVEAEAQSQQQKGVVAHSRKEADGLQRELAKVSSRIEVLKQLMDEGQGLEEGTQAVLQGLVDETSSRSGVHGVIGQYLEAEDEVAAAVEAVLGLQLQTVLVSDGAFAEQVIEVLTQKKLGMVALIPEAFLPRQGSVQLLALPEGGIAWLLDKVKIEPRVAPLLERMLEGVLMVEDLSTAMQMRDSMPEITFVTRRGVVLTGEGFIRGGEQQEGSAKMLERKNEIRQLERDCQKIEQSLEVKQQELSQQEEQQQKLLELVQQMRDESQESKGEERELSGQMGLRQREKTTMQNRLSSLERERAELEQREKEAKTENTELKEVLESSEKRLDELQRQREQFVSEFADLRHKEQAKAEQVQAHKTELAVEARAYEAVLGQMNPLKVRLVELAETVTRREQEVARSESQLVAGSKENEELGKRIERLKLDVEKMEVELRVGQARRTDLLEVVREIDQGTVTLREKVRQISEECGAVELEMTKQDLAMQNIYEAMEEKYQTDIVSFQHNEKVLRACLQRHGVADQATEVDWQEAGSIVSKLWKSRDDIGTVNVDAIEEYEELDERFQFVTAQYNDLVESKEELTGVIEKINRETKKLFGKTFEQVRENFQSMFRMLFGETGQADLRLVGEENLLESGIDIIAKPPGKSLQSITLLSGGERSMTAVALLFSIYQIKPSPFCVLDELDAPLDEANIGRFLRVLDHFIEKSQFITVTHSKRTMDRADVLYGVTTEEKGVSKPIKMRLSSQRDLPEHSGDGSEGRAAAKAARQLGAD